jgi:hypothetical protein
MGQISTDHQNPLNKFLVGQNADGTQVAILKPPKLLRPADALLLAAWLVDAADPSPDLGSFKSMLYSVQGRVRRSG